MTRRKPIPRMPRNSVRISQSGQGAESQPVSLMPPWRLNATLMIAFVMVHLIALCVLPLIGPRTSLLVVVLICVGISTTPMWALIHEAIHGLLHPRPRVNQLAGRALSIVFGAPFRALRFAHLRHHRYNRTPWGREEVYDPARHRRAIALLHHYIRITFGLYLGEIALLLLCWLPRARLRAFIDGLCPDVEGTRGMARFADREVLSSGSLEEIRTDALLTMALYGTAFWLYAGQWIALVGMLGIRAFVVSQVDHAFHHGTPLDDKHFAWNLRAPRWAERWMLNFNRHRTHHRYPQLPWTCLPDYADHIEADTGFVRGVLRQWGGPIPVSRLMPNSPRNRH